MSEQSLSPLPLSQLLNGVPPTPLLLPTAVLNGAGRTSLSLLVLSPLFICELAAWVTMPWLFGALIVPDDSIRNALPSRGP